MRLGVVMGLLVALLGVARAQEPATTLVTLGTAGGPPPRAHRAQSANLLIVKGTYYLIDAGDGVLRRMAQNHIAYTDVRRIFLTHPHDDHYAGLAPLLALTWEFGKRVSTEIYGPPGTAQIVAGALAYLKPNTVIRGTERRLEAPDVLVHAHEPIAPAQIYEDENVRVLAVENTHFHFPPDSPPFGAYKSYSYRFETPGRVMVFTGDTGFTDEVVALAHGADLLVAEANTAEDYLAVMQSLSRVPLSDQQKQRNVMHMSEEHLLPEAVGRIATAAGVKSVVLTHLPPRVDGNDDYSNYIPLVHATYGGPVAVAKDGARF